MQGGMGRPQPGSELQKPLYQMSQDNKPSAMSDMNQQQTSAPPNH